MSVLRSQVYNSLRWGFLLKLLAHQFLVFSWSRTAIHFLKVEYSLLSAYGKSWITWESTLSKDPSRALLSPLAKSEDYCFMLSRFDIGGHRGVGSAVGWWLQVKNGWNFSPDLKISCWFYGTGWKLTDDKSSPKVRVPVTSLNVLSIWQRNWGWQRKPHVYGQSDHQQKWSWLLFQLTQSVMHSSLKWTQPKISCPFV